MRAICPILTVPHYHIVMEKGKRSAAQPKKI